MNAVNTIVEEPQLLISRCGSVGRIRLNRPKALNSLTLEMVRRIEEALNCFEEDPDVAVVLVAGEGERGFCAGGDIRAIYQSGRTGSDLAATFWREEYRLDARIRRFPKPYVVIIDGITMGGGVGIAAHGSHRVVTEQTSLAMPETGIGFFPDVGATWLLSRGPGEIGTFLGLTGQQIGAADAISAGLADLFVPKEELPALEDALSAIAANSTAGRISRTIERFSRPPPASSLNGYRAILDRAFSFDTVEEIFAALDAEDDDFARKVRETLDAKSPTSLKVALRLLRLGRNSSSLEECLDREFSAAVVILKGQDFYEGIRAAVIDKDRKPRWSPQELAAVSDDAVASHLKPHDQPLFAGAQPE